MMMEDPRFAVTNQDLDETDGAFGEPIFTYTARQAIEDGLLVEASPETHPNWLFSRAVFDAIMSLPELKDEEPHSLKYRQRVIPLLMDVQMVCGTPEAKNDSLYTGDQLDGNLTRQKLWFAINDIGGITIMFPSDY